MFKVILSLLMVGSLAVAQEAEDLLGGPSDHIKYGYTHEVFSHDEKSLTEDWLHLRLGDLTGSVELRDGKQNRIQLNSTLGRLLGLKDKGLGSLLHSVQVEGKSDTKRADYLLLGMELSFVKSLSLYFAGVMNDAGATRVIFGPLLYWDKLHYTSLFIYPGQGFQADGGAVNLRHHYEQDLLFIEAQAVLKAINKEIRAGGGVKVGYGVFGVKAQYTPNYEGSQWDRMLYGFDLDWKF